MFHWIEMTLMRTSHNKNLHIFFRKNIQENQQKLQIVEIINQQFVALGREKRLLNVKSVMNNFLPTNHLNIM